MATAFESLADRLELNEEERETAKSLIAALPSPLVGGEACIKKGFLSETLGLETGDPLVLGERLFALMTPHTAQDGVSMPVLSFARFENEDFHYQFSDEFLQTFRALSQGEHQATL